MIKENSGTKADMTALLQKLISFPTVNPPGNEREAAEFLKSVLDAEDIRSELIEKKSGRTNLLAYLGEETSEEPLILLSHIDVVKADEHKWEFPPFSGTLSKGAIWGRGAIDAKGLTIMHLSAFMSAHRRIKENKWKPNRQIIFAATADEENGSIFGAGHLINNVDIFKKPCLVLSEGGGFPIRMKGEQWMVVTVGEKGRINLKITARGDGGHASCPPENQSIKKLAEWIGKLTNYVWDLPCYETLNKFKEVSGVNKFWEQKDLISKLGQYLESPGVYLNVINAGSSLNVIPPEAVCELEIGMFPNWDEEYMARAISEISRDSDVDVEIISCTPAFECQNESYLLEMMDKVIKHEHNEYQGILPILALGRTDGRFFGSNGSTSFGFSPLLPDMPFSDVLKMVHQKDEYITGESLNFGSRVIENLLFQICSYNNEEGEQ